MGYLSVVTYPDDRLRQECEDITDFGDDFQALVDDMLESMIYHKGVGLAAPQVGVLKNLIVVSPKCNLKEHYVFANPVISNPKGEIVDCEGCLSVPCASGDVARAKKISFEALDRNGKPVSFTATDFFARILQHETDHLHGKLFIDHLGFADRREAIEAARKAKEL